MLITELARLAHELHVNMYDLAVIDEHSAESLRLQPSNACNDSYSVAKAFTMTAIGILQDRGLLNVNDHISQLFRSHFPGNYDPNWDSVTIEHALLHRIGFDHGFLDIDTEDISKYGTRDFLSMLFSRPLPYAPGSHEVYSDAAFYLLSRVVSEITGRKLDDFLTEELFNPLGFQEAAWSKCPMGYAMGATGLYVSSRDMARLGELYLNGGVYGGARILSDAWVRQALSCGYELHRVGTADAYAKGGMYGQMLFFSRSARVVVAWHAFDDTGAPGEFLERLVALLSK